MRILVLIALNVILSLALAVTTPYFFTVNNIVVIIDNMALEAIILSGYTLLLVGGLFDLSVDGVVALTGIVAGLSMNKEVPWIIAVIMGMLVGGLVGLANGIIVTKLKINGLIATLTTWWICIGISLGITKALTPYNFPDAFQALGQSRLYGFRILVVYAAVAIIFFSIILHLTSVGAHLYARGDSPLACEMMGINTANLGTLMYVILGLLSGFVGLMTAARLNAASPMAVDGMTLRIIAAAVIGGVRLNGGSGSIVGGLLGLVLMNILGNAMIQLGVSPYWQKGVLGGALLIAVLVETIRRRN